MTICVAGETCQELITHSERLIKILFMEPLRVLVLQTLQIAVTSIKNIKKTYIFMCQDKPVEKINQDKLISEDGVRYQPLTCFSAYNFP